MATEIHIGGVTALENGSHVMLIRADGVPAPQTFLSGPELEKFVSFKIDKRRRDWLGGRYAAKTLLKESLGLQTPLSAIEISYDPFGRPVWAGGGIRHLISITHSGPFCAAACGAAGTKFIGLDLEKAEPRAGAWYEDYFHKAELSAAVRQQDSTTAGEFDYRSQAVINAGTILWTLKEALLKALGLGLKADPLDINIAQDTPQFSRTALKRYEEMGEPPFRLETFTPEPDWYLSIACETTPKLLK